MKKKIKSGKIIKATTLKPGSIKTLSSRRSTSGRSRMMQMIKKGKK